MTYAHAYYASSYDKKGKTNYLKNVTSAFIDGRKLITAADGNKLSKAELNKIQDYVQIICSNWEDVIALATSPKRPPNILITTASARNWIKIS